MRPFVLLVAAVALGCAPPPEATTPRPAPAPVRVRSLSAAHHATCAVTDDDAVYCWGADCHGAPTDGMLNFVCSVPRRLDGLSNITAYVLGGSFMTPDCALRRDGSVTCGRIRDGFRTSIASGARAVAHADEFACALLESGHVTCWGFLPLGGTRRGTISDATTPVEMHGPEDVVHLTARTGRACAVASDARVWCWTYATKVDASLVPLDGPPTGRIVLGAKHDYVDLGLSRLPWHIDPIRSFTEGGATCFLSPGGSLRCTGGATSHDPGIIEMSTRRFETLAMGLEHGCALSSGKAYCWGFNGAGQLGTSGGARHTLAPVRAQEDFVDIVSGYNHNCARTPLGAVWCWGANSDGELGAGTRTAFERHPVRVLGFGG